MNALDNGMQACTVKLIYTTSYVRHLVQISYEKSFAVLSQTGKYFAECVKTKKKRLNPNMDLPYLFLGQIIIRH